MMKVEQILQKALVADVALYLNEGKLAYVAGEQGVPDALRAEIVAHKQAIIEFLSQTESGEGQSASNWPLQKLPAEEQARLSAQQQQVWFAERLGSHSQFNISNAFNYAGNLDVDMVQQALQHIIARHQILCTVYRVDNEGELQLDYLQAEDFHVAFEDFSTFGQEEQQIQVADYLALHQQERFDLEASFPVRVACLKLADDSYVLSITLHHIASDGWSLDILVAEFGMMYQALQNRQALNSSDLPIQYSDYAYSQHLMMQSEGFSQQLALWLNTFDGVDGKPILPTDFPRPDVFVNQGQEVQISVAKVTLDKLKQLATSQHCTLFMVLEVAFGVLISRWTKSSQLIIGSPVAGREHEETRALIGLFVNMLALKHDFATDNSFSETLEQQRDVIIKAFEMQSLPIETLIEKLELQQNLAYSPLFQIVFNLQNVGRSELQISEAQLSALPQKPLIKYDLEVVAIEDGEQLSIAFKYADTLFRAETISAVAQEMQQLLEYIVLAPDASLNDWQHTAAFTGILAVSNVGEEEGQEDEDDLLRSLRCLIESNDLVRQAKVERSGSAQFNKVVAHVLLQDSTVEIGSEAWAQFVTQIEDFINTSDVFVPQPDAWQRIDPARLDSTGVIKNRHLTLYHFPLVTETEQQLASIWKDVLECDIVGRTDNFFDIGGNSLRAMRVISRIKEDFSVEMKMLTLFESPTLHDFALQIEQQHQEKIVEILPSPKGEMLPLSYAQKRLWLIDKINGGSAQYNMPFAYVIYGELDMAALQQALNSLIKQHDTLNTVYRKNETGPYQLVTDITNVPIHFIDFSDLPENKRMMAVEQEIQSLGDVGFDLANDLMLRVHLFKTDQDTHCLLLNIHHIAADGWSIGLLTKDFSRFYVAAKEKNVITPQVPAITYGDFAYWQSEQYQQTKNNDELSYWQQRLQGLPLLHHLPMDHSRPVSGQFHADYISCKLGAARMEKLSAICQDANVTLFILLHSIFAVMVSRYSNCNDVAIGTPVAGRVNKAVESLVGLFANTMVLRNHLDADQPFLEFLQQNRDDVLEAFNHQHVPFDMVVESVQPERAVNFNPLVQILFVLQNNEREELNIPGLEIYSLRHQQSLAKFDLILYATEYPDDLELGWEYCVELFNPETVQQFSEGYLALVDAVIDNLEQPIAELSVAASTAGIEAKGNAKYQLYNGYAFNADTLVTQLCQHPNIQNAYLRLLVNKGKTSMVAYVVPDGVDGTLDDAMMAEIQHWASENLVAHLTPETFVIVNEIPLTADGEVDEQALPDVAQTIQAQYQAPESDIEIRLVQLWEQLLGKENFGVLDNFFDVGGDSLRITMLYGEIKAAFEIEVPMKLLFVHQTVSAQATLIESFMMTQSETSEDSDTMIEMEL